MFQTYRAQNLFDLHYDYAANTTSDFISRLSPQAREFLDYQLDQDHHGVDEDLVAIARPMVDWKEKLSIPIGLTFSEIRDIEMGQYRDNHLLQRCVVATY